MLKKHGKHDTTEYHIWEGIKQRCTNPKNPKYQNYGGRGIRVCERWHTFENFYADMGNRPSLKHSIDRLDVNGNYDPANCRWATITEQARNSTTNHIVEWEGKSMCLAEVAEVTGVPYKLLLSRLDGGKRSVQEAVNFVPICDTNKDRSFEWGGVIKPLSQWAKDFGINEETLRSRLNSGWSVEKALNTQTTRKTYFFSGELMGVSKISKITGVQYATLWARLKKGMSIEEAVTK